MSAFYYNDICLPFVYTQAFHQEAVFDPSNTDRMYTKFDLTVQGILNSSLATIAGVPPGDNATNGATMCAHIRKRFMEPRKQLRFEFGGTNLIPNENGTVDAANGPQPIDCQVLRLTTNTFLVSFRIVTCLCESPSTLGGGPVISIRWRETQSIDEKNFSTRTRSGQYRIRSDNLQRVQADQLRSSMAILGVPKGCQRTRAEYTVSEDGLSLQFAITDQEVFIQPPTGAYKARGRYTETTTKLGAQRYGQAEIYLEGSKTTDQAELLSMAVAICSAKLLDAGAEVSNGNSRAFARLESCVVSQDLYENNVSCSMRALLNTRHMEGQTSQPRVDGVPGIDFYAMTKMPAFSPPDGKPPLYYARGTIGAANKNGDGGPLITPVMFWTGFLQAAAYFDPSLEGVQLSATTGQLTAGTKIGTGRGE